MPLRMCPLLCWFLVGIAVFCRCRALPRAALNPGSSSPAMTWVRGQRWGITRQERQGRWARGRAGSAQLSCSFGPDACRRCAPRPSRGHVYFHPGLGDFGKPPSPKEKNNKMSPITPLQDKWQECCFLHRMGWVRFAHPLFFSTTEYREYKDRVKEDLWDSGLATSPPQPPYLLPQGMVWRSSLVMGIHGERLVDQLISCEHPQAALPFPYQHLSLPWGRGFLLPTRSSKQRETT